MRVTRRIALLALLLAPLAWAADIGISPPRIELVGTVGERLIGTAIVLTGADREQIIAVEVGDWTMDPFGDLVFLPTGAARDGAATWIEPEAESFVLDGRGSREVRFAVTIPAGAEGTHHAMVYFTVLPAADSAQGVGVVTTTRVALAVYVTVAGTERGGAELVDLFQADDRTIVAVIVNDGNTVMRLAGELQLRDEAGTVRHRFDVPDTPVLRDSERQLAFVLPPEVEPGFYVALALIEDSRGGLLAGELPLDVP